MLNPKAYIVEYEKNGRVGLVVIVATHPAQALEIARREKETDIATVIDETEVIFAD
jgi:BioD-like phosphotransacetylase family protein